MPNILKRCSEINFSHQSYMEILLYLFFPRKTNKYLIKKHTVARHIQKKIFFFKKRTSYLSKRESKEGGYKIKWKAKNHTPEKGKGNQCR